MRQSSKIIVLVLTLAFPVLVYLFLKSFGENRFNLPIYYSEAPETEFCDEMTFPHRAEVDAIDFSEGQATLIFFSANIQSDDIQELFRVAAKYNQVQLVLLSDQQLTGDGFLLVGLERSQYLHVADCELIMNGELDAALPLNEKAVLVDSNGQIRGYYQTTELDDLDRLEVELDILLMENDYAG
jgi:protein SCO1/2